MNTELKDFAILKIKEGLAKLKPDCQRFFKLMYGRNRGKRSVEDAEAMPIDEVVVEIPDDRLDWALTQIQNTLKKPEMLREEVTA